MPVINTRGALSATGFGFLGSEGRYWYLLLDTLAVNSQITGIVIGSDNSTYFSAYAPGQSGMTQVKLNYPGVIQWQRKLATSSTVLTNGKAMCLDNSGNSYYLAVDSGSSPAISKYNSSGTSQWIYKFTNNFTGVSLAVDSSGDLYFVGTDGFGATLKGDLVKFNSSGVIQWQKALTLGAGSSSYGGVAIDSADNVYVTGANVVLGTQYLMLVKYNSSGTLQWQRNYSDFFAPRGAAIAIDQNNVSYAAGAASNYACIAKVNSSGTDQGFFRVESTTGGSSLIGWISVAVDNLGNVYTAGNYRNAAGRVMGVVARLTDTGTLTWANTIDATTGGGGSFCTSITVDRFGDLYVGIYNSITNNEVLLKLPRNGEKLGTFGGLIYSSITSSLLSSTVAATITTTVATETTPTFAVGASIVVSSTTTMTSSLTHI